MACGDPRRQQAVMRRDELEPVHSAAQFRDSQHLKAAREERRSQPKESAPHRPWHVATESGYPVDGCQIVGVLVGDWKRDR